MRGYVNTSDTLLMLGRFDEVVATADEGETFAEQTGLSRTAGAFLRGNKIEALMRSGRWEDAMSAAVQKAESGGVFAGTLMLYRAEMHVLAGRRREAEIELRDARRELRDTGVPQYAFPLAAAEAHIALLDGDAGRAAQVVHRVLDGDIASDVDRYRWPVVWLGARIEADRAAQKPDAQQRAAELRELAAGMTASSPADRGYQALAAAEYERACGGDVVAAWRQAVSVCRQMNEPHPLAYALLRQADALATSGDKDAAATAVGEALELARRMGAAPLIELADDVIRSGRLHSLAQAPAAPQSTAEVDRLGLTVRELEVLRLVAEGHSNGEIAQQLFISRKTASVHVSNILAKLGVNTRGQAAAMAHRLGLASEP
jgi:DNA-binding CsgD family transcriptional regulator